MQLEEFWTWLEMTPLAARRVVRILDAAQQSMDRQGARVPVIPSLPVKPA
jgi:hypothetical protein